MLHTLMPSHEVIECHVRRGRRRGHQACLWCNELALAQLAMARLSLSPALLGAAEAPQRALQLGIAMQARQRAYAVHL